MNFKIMKYYLFNVIVNMRSNSIWIIFYKNPSVRVPTYNGIQEINKYEKERSKILTRKVIKMGLHRHSGCSLLA